MGAKPSSHSCPRKAWGFLQQMRVEGGRWKLIKIFLLPKYSRHFCAFQKLNIPDEDPHADRSWCTAPWNPFQGNWLCQEGRRSVFKTNFETNSYSNSYTNFYYKFYTFFSKYLLFSLWNVFLVESFTNLKYSLPAGEWDFDLDSFTRVDFETFAFLTFSWNWSAKKIPVLSQDAE